MAWSAGHYLSFAADDAMLVQTSNVNGPASIFLEALQDFYVKGGTMSINADNNVNINADDEIINIGSDVTITATADVSMTVRRLFCSSPFAQFRSSIHQQPPGG